MPKVFTSKSQKTGELGENLAEKYLKKKGYRIIERNYTIPQGEIDIIAKEGNDLIFVEVKAISVSPETFDSLNKKEGIVTRGTNSEKNLENKGLSNNNVPRETKEGVTRGTENDSIPNTEVAETGNIDKGHQIQIRPEDNMHPGKLQKLYRTIEIYMSDKDVFYKTKWRIDLLSVFIDIHSKRVKVEHYKNVNM
jgi:putative endonuclease